MAADDAFAAFESKWIAAHPEFGLALGFIPAAQRRSRSAFACIGFEIAHAALRIAEAQVAAGKLQWWLDEFAALAAGQARHPLTLALAADRDVSRVPLTLWREFIAAALAQRDNAPPSTLDALLADHHALYLPWARAGEQLFGDRDPAAVAGVHALSRAFRETLALPDRLADGRLVVPLDVLARHRLSRGDLAASGPARTGALRDHLESIVARMDACTATALPVLEAVTLHVDRSHCRRAARARDPLAAGARGSRRVPFSTPWAAWRAARHAQAG